MGEDLEARTRSLASQAGRLRRLALMLLLVDAMIAAAWLGHAHWVRVAME